MLITTNHPNRFVNFPLSGARPSARPGPGLRAPNLITKKIKILRLRLFRGIENCGCSNHWEKPWASEPERQDLFALIGTDQLPALPSLDVDGALDIVKTFLFNLLLLSSLRNTPGAIFSEEQKDTSIELAFKYAVYKINKDRSILPKTTLVYDIQVSGTSLLSRGTGFWMVTRTPLFGIC